MEGRTNIIDDFRDIAQNVLPKGSQVWLYGSRARGDNGSESDWDLLILVDKSSVGTADEDEYSYPFVLAGWQHAAAVNPLLYTYSEWQRRKASPFYENVEHDKIMIAHG
ncbi:MAG: nucleotidyltransferase domain-containing protein [Prevotella sp.]|nr:nucleotidyltransferase domain-containing protein [Candidatus Prevotella equi]